MPTSKEGDANFEGRRCQLRRHGGQPPGEISDDSQGTPYQTDKLGKHHNDVAENNTIPAGSPRAGNTERAPNPLNKPGSMPARASGDYVKLKEGLKPTTLMLNFNPQEFQAWQNKFKIYYRTSHMNMGDAKEQRGCFHSCISEHLQAVNLKKHPRGSKHLLGRGTTR